MPTDQNDERVARRAKELLPEEEAAGIDNPELLAETLLEDSDIRTEDRDAAPGSIVEHRKSEDTVDPAV